MKKLFFALGISFSTLIAVAQPPAGDAKPGDFYGEKPSTAGAINIAEIPARLTNNETIDTKVKAKVLDVCAMKGCWLKVAINDSTTAMVKMKDYGFFAPVALKGKNIILDGEAQMTTTSVDDLKHYATDAKKSKKEIDAIKTPQKEINIVAKGIVVVD